MLEIERLLAEMAAWAEKQPELWALYLYGSQAEGRADPLSDVDIGALARPDLSRSELWALE